MVKNSSGDSRCSVITLSGPKSSPKTSEANSVRSFTESSPLPIVADVPTGHKCPLERFSFSFSLRIRLATSVPCAPS